jgi:hypothetical protein
MDVSLVVVWLVVVWLVVVWLVVVWLVVVWLVVVWLVVVWLVVVWLVVVWLVVVLLRCRAGFGWGVVFFRRIADALSVIAHNGSIGITTAIEIARGQIDQTGSGETLIGEYESRGSR